MPSGDDKLPQLFSRSINQFSAKLVNIASYNPSTLTKNQMLSTLHIHSTLTLLLFGARGRSTIEFLSLVFPEWCSYDPIVRNYRRLLNLLEDTTGTFMTTRSVITFSVNKNLNRDFMKVATECFKTELIIIKNCLQRCIHTVYLTPNYFNFRQAPSMSSSSSSALLSSSSEASSSGVSSGASSSRASSSRASSFSSSQSQLNQPLRIYNNVPDHTNPINVLNIHNNTNLYICAYVENIFTCKLSSDIRDVKLVERTYYENITKMYPAEMYTFNGRFKYATLMSMRAEVIELPLNNNDFSIIIFKPFYRWGLLTIQDSIKFDIFRDLKLMMEYKNNINVQIPKFHLKSSDILNSSLEQIGLETIFQFGIDLSNAFDNAIPAGYNGCLPIPNVQELHNFQVTQKVDFLFNTKATKVENNTENNPTKINENNEKSTECIPNKNNNVETNSDNNNSNNLNDNNDDRNDGQFDFIVDRPFLFFVRWNIFNLPLITGTIISLQD